MNSKESQPRVSYSGDVWLALYEEIDNLHEHAMGGDRVVQGFAGGLHRLIENDIEISEEVRELLDIRLSKRTLSSNPETRKEEIEEQAAYFVRLLFSATQRLYWGEDKHKDYPHHPEYTSVDFWQDELRNSYRKESETFAQIKNDVKSRELMSNISQRYLTLKLLLASEGERWDYGPNVLDVGCSLMHGDMKLLSEGKVSFFDPPSVRENRKNQEGNYADIDHELSEIMAEIALREYMGREKGHHTGVDRMSTLDNDTIAWARNNSFWPKEIIEKPRLLEAFDEINQQATDPKVSSRLNYIAADFTQDQRELFSDRRFDVIFISTMLYQLNKEERKIAFRNARELLSDDGLIVIQDGAELDRNDPEWLSFSAAKFRQNYQYKTYIYDAAAKDRGVQLFLIWGNGRCRQMVFANSRFSLETKDKLLQKF